MSARRLCAPAIALALAAAGCGGGVGSLSAHQLRAAATSACGGATQQLDRIPTPQIPSEGASFLHRGIAALGPELTALSALHPEGELGVQFRRARSATEQELATLQSTLKGLKAGNDPIVAFKTLQAQLAPLEERASAAWQALKIPACIDT